MSLKDVPITHFRVAVEELNYRYKVCLALAGLVDEVVDLGSTEGKVLAKVIVLRSSFRQYFDH
jgi:hypothetical protein